MARAKLFWRLLWHGRWRPIEAGIAVIGLYDTLVGEFLPDWPRVGILLPQVKWWGWFILLLIVILFAVLEGAYRISLKSNEAVEEFFFEYTGFGITTKTGSVYLNATFRAKPKVIVDGLWLDINGVRFPPLEWKPFIVSPQYTSSWGFDLAGKVKQDETHIGKLIAKIDKKEHESREFKV